MRFSLISSIFSTFSCSGHSRSAQAIVHTLVQTRTGLISTSAIFPTGFGGVATIIRFSLLSPNHSTFSCSDHSQSAWAIIIIILHTFTTSSSACCSTDFGGFLSIILRSSLRSPISSTFLSFGPSQSAVSMVHTLMLSRPCFSSISASVCSLTFLAVGFRNNDGSFNNSFSNNPFSWSPKLWFWLWQILAANKKISVPNNTSLAFTVCRFQHANGPPNKK